MSTIEIVELIPPPSPEEAFDCFAGRERCLFLDSAMPHPLLGRYSFLMAEPLASWELAATATPEQARAVLEQLAGLLRGSPTSPAPGLPPFQGGLAGLFAYDLNRAFERIAPPRFDEFGCPQLSVGLYDTVLAFDHRQERAWIIARDFTELAAHAGGAEPAEARRLAGACAGRPAPAARAAIWRRWLNQPPDPHGEAAGKAGVGAARRGPAPPRRLDAPTIAVPGEFSLGLDKLLSNFSAAGFEAAVRRAVDYIYAGDIFQVNLAQRLMHPATDRSPALYRRLRTRNPAPFAGYYDLGNRQILSASPERFVSVFEGGVETRPIKGTRPRIRSPEADLYSGDDLLASEKDRAENVMIVDLLRNDLSRVCLPDSVRVTQLCQLESYQYVQHLVSAVEGRLAPGETSLSLLAAAFPGGSITGAPKVRAMEIIGELEQTARGAYCGSLGYLGLDGSMDLSILIRTVTAGGGWWQMPVGGGIVAQSEPRREYEETWAKARGMLQALRP